MLTNPVESAYDTAVELLVRDARLMSAARAIRRGATSFAARARSERAGILSLNQTAVLGLLRRHSQITPTEIADRLNTSLQALTRTIASLEEQGMLARAVDPADRRQSILTATAAGIEALNSEMRPRDEWLAGVMERTLTPAEQDFLVVASRLLERLADVDSAVAPLEP